MNATTSWSSVQGMPGCVQHSPPSTEGCGCWCSSAARRRSAAGSMRFAYEGIDDLLELVPDLPESELERTDFGSYPESQFLEDMARVTKYRADSDLVEILVRRSYDTLRWMRDKGVRFYPSYRRQASPTTARPSRAPASPAGSAPRATSPTSAPAASHRGTTDASNGSPARSNTRSSTATTSATGSTSPDTATPPGTSTTASDPTKRSAYADPFELYQHTPTTQPPTPESVSDS